MIDFRRSLPPVPPGMHEDLTRAFRAVADAGDLAALMHETVPGGTDAQRAAAARWLAPRFGTSPTSPASPASSASLALDRLLLTNGTQTTITLLLRHIVGPGGLLLAERLSYGPLRLLAQAAGVRVAGVTLDRDGLDPDAFEAACRAHAPTALYCNPTAHNPTTAMMPAARRLAIAAIARRYGVTIVEDDALGRLQPGAPPPIAALAPDVTWYVMTMTKCLTQGLRVAIVVAPSAEAVDRVIGPERHLSHWHPAPLLAALFAQWVESGVAERIRETIGFECLARELAARELLAEHDLASTPGSMHVWLRLPPGRNAVAFARDAEARDILLRPASAFAVEEERVDAVDAVDAVRLSLSTPATIGDVVTGLDAVRGLLAGERYTPRHSHLSHVPRLPHHPGSRDRTSRL